MMGAGCFARDNRLFFFNALLYRWGRTSWCSGIHQNSPRFYVQRNSGESHYLQIPALKRGIAFFGA